MRIDACVAWAQKHGEAFSNALVAADRALQMPGQLPTAADELGHALQLALDAPTSPAPIRAAIDAVTAAQRAPAICADHAIAAAREVVRDAAFAFDVNLSTRTMLSQFPHGVPIEESLLRAGASGKVPLGPARAATVADGRVVRDALRDVYQPLVDDLTTRARALREVPIDQIAVGAYDVQHFGPAGGAKFLDGMGTRDPSTFTYAKQFVRTSPHDLPSGNGEQLEVVVGEHGLDLAVAHAKAARALQNIVRDSLGDDAATVAGANDALVRAWTYQRYDVPNALHEGITSIAQATSLATMRQVDGMNEAGLLDALVESNVLETLARAPFGFLAQTVRSGLAVEAPVVVGAGGRLRLGPQLTAMLDDLRGLRETTRAPSPTTFTGCPVDFSELAREYVDLLKRFLAEERATSGNPARRAADEWIQVKDRPAGARVLMRVPPATTVS